MIKKGTNEYQERIFTQQKSKLLLRMGRLYTTLHNTLVTIVTAINQNWVKIARNIYIAISISMYVFNINTQTIRSILFYRN